MSRVAQGHHHLTNQHIFESPVLKQMVVSFSNYQQTQRKKKEKKKDTEDFIAFVSSLEKLSNREQRETGKIIQHHEGGDRKFKFHIMKMCGGI